MANYSNLKAAINAVIKQNGQGEITGEVMNQVLTAMVNSLGSNYLFAGVATPSTNPGTPDQNVFYMATQAGTYTNFSAIVLQAGISILLWNGSWSSETFFEIDSVPTSGSGNFISSGAVFDKFKLDGGAYDVSAHNNNQTFASLSALLSDANLSTLIPTNIRSGGMSIKFIQTSDNKYVQYRLMATSFSNTVANWQGIDDEPTAGSDNLVKSGGVFSCLSEKLPSELFGMQEMEFIDDYYLVLNLSTPTYSVNWRYVKKAVKENEIYIISGKGTELTPLWRLYSSDGTVIDTSENTQENGKVLQIPSGVAWLVINDNKSGCKCYQGYNLDTKIFNRGDLVTADLDTLFEGGTYKYSSGQIVIVNRYSNTNIRQIRLGGLSTVGMNLEYRTYNGENWTDWKRTNFNDSYLDDERFDELITEGIYRGYGQYPLLIVIKSGNTTTQYRVVITSSEFNYRIQARYKVGSNAWTVWELANTLGFTDTFDYTDINNITTSGIYRVNNYTSDYGFPFLLVRKENTLITQVRFTISLAGGFSIAIRQSTDGGTTWGNWKDYLDDIESSLKILNADIEKTQIVISEQTKVDAAITSDGKWTPTSPGAAGKSCITECVTGISRILVNCPTANSISFLRGIPSSFTVATAADFAIGETGRRTLSVGENTIIIPSGTKYIVYNYEDSHGHDMAPTDIALYYSANLLSADNFARQVVGVYGQVINNNIIELENVSNVTPVSDPLSAFASGECNVYHEPETGLVYFTCIEGFDHPYEAYDCVSLYVFSLTNPNKVERFEIAKASDKGVSRCYTPNIVTLSYKNAQNVVVNTKKVRVFYTFQDEDNTDGAYLYYKDFDFNTKAFSEEHKVTLSSDSSILTAAAIRTFTINNGGVDTNKHYIYIQKITDVDSDGYRYCTLNCGESINYNIVVARSNDNFATLEMLTITPFIIRYDCALGLLGSKLYFVFRIGGGEYVSTSGTSLCTAEILSGAITNWSTPTKFAEGDSRPDCYVYNEKVYMMAGNLHSVQGVPMRVSSSVWEGTSDNPTEYAKVLIVSDTRGVQNPRVFRYGCGDYGVLMQNSPARVDYPSQGGAQWQFKTAICFVCSRIN